MFTSAQYFAKLPSSMGTDARDAAVFLGYWWSVQSGKPWEDFGPSTAMAQQHGFSMNLSLILSPSFEPFRQGIVQCSTLREVKRFLKKIGPDLERFMRSFVSTHGVIDPAVRVCAGCCCDKSQAKLLRCAGCRQTWYCSPACQRKDWKTHKPTCKFIQTL